MSFASIPALEARNRKPAHVSEAGVERLRKVRKLCSSGVAAAAGLILVSFQAGTIAPARAGVQAPSAGALSTDACSTAQLSDLMAVYTARPAPHATPYPLPPNTRSYVTHVIGARLQECSTKLRAEGGIAAADACLPRDGDVGVLWTQLQLCDALVNPKVPASPGIRWQLPPVVGSQSQPVIFVLGAGGDAAMLGKLISSLTVYLDQAGYYLADNAVLIPEPAWSPDAFATQCQSSPQVEGAIVVQITAAGAGSSDLFVSRKSWSAIEATALYARCERDRPAAAGVPTYIWASDIASAQNRYITVTPLTPLALLLTLGAAYEEFAPARTSSTTQTHVYPTPVPTPPGGWISQQMTTNATTVNASTLGGVAASFLASTITYTNSTAPLTQQPTIDQQTWDTLQNVALNLVGQMNCWQPPAKANNTFKDVVGGARRAPSYNPPPGLNEYAFGKPSAPFCEQPNPALDDHQGGESIRDVLPSPLPPRQE
jgi:hypothetical protein